MAERLSVEALRYARAVAETQSFSAAARAYGVSQPALSNGIAKLEERLGGKLFDRSPRGVTRTEFGARLLPLIDQALAGLDAVAAEARRLTEPAAGKIRMGVSPLIGGHLVARAFSAVRALPTPRDLVLREAGMENLRTGLLAGDLDIILVPAVAPLPRFEHRVVEAEPIVVVGSDVDDRPLELGEAGGEEFILVPDSCGLTTFTTQLFQEHELPLRAYPDEAASYRVLEEWAGLGLGAAMLPRSKLTSAGVRHRPLLAAGRAVRISYEAVWSAGTSMGADLELLAERLSVA
ncbi:LysR family transcriptional regulator [Amycolatopsis sp. FBCC-B4732]|uniref:LysR family transcriptional regulator n=1 Tax=Amycolatopsis sp. FBCC-B4732 TaxID=3079339 RepID=UPI001FF220F3|nr:LysR family transcriptional regulator [Amycolatopsis sp. FBCC-B4732]UOX92230.1 LysR family transcriptional regulator [Amycolatopsis sp. FBCC-B4732]